MNEHSKVKGRNSFEFIGTVIARTEIVRLQEGLSILAILRSESSHVFLIIVGEALEVFKFIKVGDRVDCKRLKRVRWKWGSDDSSSPSGHEGMWMLIQKRERIKHERVMVRNESFHDHPLCEAFIAGRIISFSPLGFILIKTSSDGSIVFVFFTHSKIDKSCGKWDSLKIDADVSFDCLLPTDCVINDSTTFIFTIRSSFHLSSSIANPENTSSTVGFSIPSLLRSRCCFYSIWLAKVQMELGQLYSIPPLSIDLLDLCLEIEKWTAGQIDSFEISHFRDVRREFTDVLYYELYLFRGGEDLNYLDNLLPKVIGLPTIHSFFVKAQSQSPSITNDFNLGTSYSNSFSSVTWNLKEVYDVRIPLLVGHLNSVLKLNGGFYALLSGESEDIEYGLSVFDEVVDGSEGIVFSQSNLLFQHLSEKLAQHCQLLVLIKNCQMSYESTRSSLPSSASEKLRKANILIKVRSADLLIYATRDAGQSEGIWKYDSRTPAPTCDNKEQWFCSSVSSVMQMFSSPSSSDKQLCNLRGVVIRKDVLAEEYNNSQRQSLPVMNILTRVMNGESSSVRQSPLEMKTKYVLYLRDEARADYVKVYISSSCNSMKQPYLSSDAVDPSRIFVGMKLEVLQAQLRFSSHGKRRIYFIFSAQQTKLRIVGFVSCTEQLYLETQFSPENRALLSKPGKYLSFLIQSPRFSLDNYPPITVTTFLHNPRTAIESLSRLMGSIVFIRKVEVIARCSLCNRQHNSSRSESSSRLVCGGCRNTRVFVCQWLVVAAFDDGSGECHCLFEEDLALQLLMQSSSLSALEFRKCKLTIESEARDRGRVSYDSMDQSWPSQQDRRSNAQADQSMKLLLKSFSFGLSYWMLVKALPDEINEREVKDGKIKIQVNNDFDDSRHYSKRLSHSTSRAGRIDCECFYLTPHSTDSCAGMLNLL